MFLSHGRLYLFIPLLSPLKSIKTFTDYVNTSLIKEEFNNLKNQQFINFLWLYPSNYISHSFYPCVP